MNSIFLSEKLMSPVTGRQNLGIKGLLAFVNIQFFMAEEL